MKRKTFSPGPTYVSEPRPILQRRGRRRACENTGSAVQRAPTLATLDTPPQKSRRARTVAISHGSAGNCMAWLAWQASDNGLREPGSVWITLPGNTVVAPEPRATATLPMHH